MSFPFNITNPGIFIDGLLTSAERTFVTDLFAAGSLASEDDILTWKSGAPSWEPNAGSGGYTNLTQFVDQTAWRLFYSNVSGDVVELALGSAGTYLQSNGASSAPTWQTPAGTVDGSGTTNEIAYWVDSNTLGALAVATYPSLTQLSYVKGVTSAIQTQIDGKAASSHTHTLASITDVTSSAAELNILDGATLTVTELNYVDGVTSAIQGQLDAKQPLDAQLTSLSGLTFASNALKVVRVNAGETDFELATPAGGGDVTKVGTPVDNQIGVWTGDGTIEGDPDLTWDGGLSITVDDTENKIGLTITQNDVTNAKSGLHIISAVPAAALTSYPLIIENTDASNNGAFIATYHNSATPVANDCIGGWDVWGEDSNGNAQAYAFLNTFIVDPTSTSEDALWAFSVAKAGSVTRVLDITGTTVEPSTSDGMALGTSTKMFSDLFLASGGVINWGNGDLTLTQTGNRLTVAGGNLDLETGGNILVNNANPKRTLVLSGAGGIPTTTIGCGGPTKVEAGTNDIDYMVLEFDTTTEERAFWNVVMPDNWDASTLTAQFFWTNAGGSSTQTVDWGIKALAFADDAAIDQAYGSEITTTDTWLAQGDVHISATSSAITVGGSPAGGQLVVFNVGRKTASDNMSGDARLIAVKIEYGINAYSD